MIVKGTNIIMFRGDSETLTISCDNYQFKDGDIVELTVRPSVQSSISVLYKKIEQFSFGAATIELLPIDTKYLIPGNYKYDVSLTTADGIVKTIIPTSTITFKGDVTHE